MNGTIPSPPVRRRDRAARRLGLSGLWLAGLLTLGAWLGVWATLAPAQAALRDAQVTLTRLDAQLASVQDTLAPLDVLARPETLDAARTLEALSETARSVPLLTTLFPDGALTRSADAARDWRAALEDRAAWPALQDARAQVQAWQAQLRTLTTRLTLLTVGGAALLTLLCAWFAAGQLALIRLSRRGGP
ncbi:hypothetical protein [Deinococcus sp. JMULE3]|uniref:hypothetical protein n=1 Tax=Deinococcus sp. JMULE3 TaxID=2518341 RepID=UPI0015773256|nr:hypothetical protein [Deinococcus sp. JMULE3]NTY00442.1 hypothetical protein [Deinococcus sp. JMULE3]